MKRNMIIAAALLVIAGAGALAAISAKARADMAPAPEANGMAQLNQDLIQSKIELEGWQQENMDGNLHSAQYRSVFSSDLQSMQNSFKADGQTL